MFLACNAAANRTSEAAKLYEEELRKKKAAALAAKPKRKQGWFKPGSPEALAAAAAAAKKKEAASATPPCKSILKKTPSSTRTASTASSTSTSEDHNASFAYPPIQKEVSFDRIQVTEYAIMLGDAPYADGAPIAMGPEKVGEMTYHLDDYEDLQTMMSGQKKRSGMRLGASQRTQILLNQGYAQSDIVTATRTSFKNRTQMARNLQQHQQRTNTSRTFDKFTESAWQGVKSLVTGNKTGKDYADYPADLSALTLVPGSSSSKGGDEEYYEDSFSSGGEDDLDQVLMEHEAKKISRDKAAATRRTTRYIDTPGPASTSKRRN